MIWVDPLWVLWRQWVFSGWTHKLGDWRPGGGHSREPSRTAVLFGPENWERPPTHYGGHRSLPAATRDWTASNPAASPGDSLAPRLHVTSLTCELFRDCTCKSFKVKLCVCARSASRFVFIYKRVSRICRKGHPFFTELYQHLCLSEYQHHGWVHFCCKDRHRL